MNNVRLCAEIKDLGNGQYQILWYYEKNGEQVVRPLLPGGTHATLRNLAILIKHGYAVEPEDILQKLQEEEQKSHEF